MSEENQEVAVQDEPAAAPVAAYALFELVKEKMEVYVNLRIEKHGDNNVNGYDIKVKGRFSNHAILPKLDESLLPAFYTDDKQREVDEFKRKLRFPRIKKAMPWDWSIPRVVATLHDEHNNEDLIIHDNDLDTFHFLPRDGGTVEFGFRIKTRELTEDQVMQLLRCNGQECTLSVECKPEDVKADNFQQAMDLGSKPEDMSPARAAAEEAFKKIAEEEAAQQLAQAAEGMAPEVSNVAPITAAKPRGKRTANGAEIVAE